MNLVENGNIKVGTRLIYYSGGFDKNARDGVFTTVVSVTPTGRFRIRADNTENLYYPDTLRRICKKVRNQCPPYCRLINEDNKELEERALKRLWIDRLKSINFETLSSEQLQAFIGTANTHGVK